MNEYDFDLECFLGSYRSAAGLSQSELARLVGTTKNTISSIELGRSVPRALLAARLCYVLHCRFEDLFCLSYRV